MLLGNSPFPLPQPRCCGSHDTSTPSLLCPYTPLTWGPFLCPLFSTLSDQRRAPSPLGGANEEAVLVRG